MASDDVWQIFQPKLSTKKITSNLSQISSFSLGNRSRLSLSCGSFTTWSSQVQLKGKNPGTISSTPKRTRGSQEKTPKSSPMQRTPTSSRKKSTPKRNSPRDGLTQKKIDSYFGSATKQSTASMSVLDVDVIDLTSDREDDETPQKNVGEGLRHQKLKKLSNVSRTLFPETSQVSSEKIVNDDRLRGKENLNEFQDVSFPIKDYEESEIAVDVFKPHQPFKCIVPSNSSFSVISPHSKDNVSASELLKRVTPSATTVDDSNQTSREIHLKDDTFQSCKSTDNEVVTSLVQSHFNGGELPDKVPKGKNNLVEGGKVVIEASKKICEMKRNIDQSQQSRDNLVGIAQEIDSLENFTGVTECVSNRSSGEKINTAYQCWSSDSDDFERELLEMKSKKPLLKKNLVEKVKDKNFSKKMSTKCKQSIIKKGEKKSSEADAGTVIKNVNPSLPNNSVLGKERLEVYSVESSKKVPKTLMKDCTLPGGFFPDDDEKSKLPGQAFVIRTPSQEYLSCWEDLMEDSVITVEHEKILSDSEKSSVIADISAVTEIMDKSLISAKTSSTVIPGKGNRYKKTGDFHLESNVEVLKNNADSLPYLSDLAGVSLSNSQWNNILNCQKSADVTRNGISNKTNMKKNCDCNHSVFSPKDPQRSEISVQPLSERRGNRASSPHEAEIAPQNIGFGVRNNPDSKQLETSPEKATLENSQPTSKSSFNAFPPKDIHSNLSSGDEPTNMEKVREWITKTYGDKTSEGERNSIGKLDNNVCHSKQKLTHHYPISKHTPGTKKKFCSMRYKTCDVKCQVKIFVKSNTPMNDSVVKSVKRMTCEKGNSLPSRENQKTSGFLAVEVQDIVSSKDQRGEEMNQKKNRTASQFDSQSTTETENLSETTSCERYPIKVQVKYGKWGWKELEIDCTEGVENVHNVSKPFTFCIQEVTVNICYCSRFMQVDCIISKEAFRRSDSNLRSRYTTSLRDYISRWGLGDEPITLAVVAYSKLYTTLDDSFSSSIPHSEKDTIIYDEPSGQFSIQTSMDFPDAMNSPSRDPQNSSSITGRRNLSEEYESEEQDTPLGLSDDFQEWMTQTMETETSENDAASKWKHLMQKMRSGPAKSSISSSSSSHSSVTSQGTSGGEQRQRFTRHGREAKPRNCPFYKRIQGTTFVVDAFSYGTIPGITHYFLSHFHYDHYMGLNKNFKLPIYCSSVTARLVNLKLKVEPSLLRRIDPGQTIKVENVKITALDANHCPGSVMFLFELPNGKTHLHCGDFRAHPCMESYHALWNVDIDQLYLDTTYCDPTYNFPSQQEIIKDILNIVEEELADEPKTLIVCGSYTIGKERVFAAIAEHLKAKIWAPYDKFRVLQSVKEGLKDLASNNVDVEGGAGRELGLVQALSLLTKVKEEAQIHVLPMAYLKKKVLEEHLYSIKGMVFNKIVAFRPTGWAHGRSKGTGLVLNSPEIKIYDAAYSEHSSFSEMARFVKFIRPKQVVKTVNVGSPRKRQAMERHINSWLAVAKSNVPIPSKINESPNSAKVLEEQKRAGNFQARSLFTRKNASKALFFKSSRTSEFSGNAALSSQTSQSQKGEYCQSASGVANKRTFSVLEVPSKRQCT